MAVFVVAYAFFAPPATWVLMMLLGNLGMELSYVAMLPRGVLASALLGGVTIGAYELNPKRRIL